MRAAAINLECNVSLTIADGVDATVAEAEATVAARACIDADAAVDEREGSAAPRAYDRGVAGP